MKKILIIVFSILCMGANAQSLKDLLAAKKQEAKDKAMAKADQKSTQAIDKAIEAPEAIAKKKKEKKEKKKADAELAKQQKREADSLQIIANAADPNTPQRIIQTNVTCNAGKKKIEAALKKHKGIIESKIDISNGEISIRYNAKSTTYIALLQMLNELGFEADGNKPLQDALTNPCK